MNNPSRERDAFECLIKVYVFVYLSIQKVYFVSQSAWISWIGFFFLFSFWCVYKSFEFTFDQKKRQMMNNPNKQRLWNCARRWKEMRHVFMCFGNEEDPVIYFCDLLIHVPQSTVFYTNDYISMKNEYSSRYSFIEQSQHSIWLSDSYIKHHYTQQWRRMLAFWSPNFAPSINRKIFLSKKKPCSNYYINLNEWRLSTGKDETKNHRKEKVSLLITKKPSLFIRE